MISVGTANVLNLLLKKEKEKNPIFYNDRTENVWYAKEGVSRTRMSPTTSSIPRAWKTNVLFR